jgi:hypothetical protein
LFSCSSMDVASFRHGFSASDQASDKRKWGF